MKFSAPFSFSAHHFSGFAIALLALILLNGCQDPPEACFRVDNTVVDQNAEVTFTNCSQFQQEGYDWDLGDGSTSNAVSVIHRFTSRGEFLVSLTSKATNELNNSTVSEIIRVGTRTLTSAEITTFPANPVGGGDWDVADGPDLALVFVKNNAVAFQTPTQDNVNNGQTVSFDLTNTNFDLTPDNWSIYLADMDGTTAFDTMAVFTEDFSLWLPNEQEQVRLSSPTVAWTINYDVR